MDDSTPSFATSVALNGITTINAGESVIFIESATLQAPHLTAYGLVQTYRLAYKLDITVALVLA